MTEEKSIQLSMFLKGELKGRFLAIKRKLGIKSNTEVVRYIISKYYEGLNHD